MCVKIKHNLTIFYSLQSKGINLVLIEITKNVLNGVKRTQNNNSKKIENLKSLCYLGEIKFKWLHPSFLTILFSPTEVHTSRHMHGMKYPNRKSDHHSNYVHLTIITNLATETT